jgi:SAM-dependent methyltransferase
MLSDPRSHAPYPYRDDRLEVLWMDARKLEFPPQSFDLVFTISSIEHFGSRRDIAQAARELGRVLKPGGYAVVITDCVVRLHPLDATPAGFVARALTRGRRSAGARLFRRGMLKETFTPRELRAHIVEPSGLELVQPLDLRVSPETWATLDFEPGVPEERGGRPQLLVKAGRSYLTSVCLVLTKPDAGA